ncbi:MAG TPA: serine/threonine-protein kinase [Pseudonocardia sp.]|nr:serine/threonine-protein kinase [Pseudonocardia sp.]
MNAPPDEPRLIGNRYRLDERIGAGAMGAVWRGTDELLNRTVAVKELIAAVGGDGVEESRQRLLREGRIGARLQHPHVISMFDVVVHDERPWLVMEYLPSRSLAAVLGERGPMSPVEAAGIGRLVADGLAAAHAAGVVHRDVKPGNVLIADDGRVKLTDFGVSRATDDVQLTRTGLIAGTPAFLAPEVARGQDPTPASDVFALGATLYAAVEGHPPFGLEENPYALLHRVATGAVEPPAAAGPLTAVLMRLLHSEAGRRPTAAEARDALARVADGRVAAMPQAAAPAAGPATAVLEPPAVRSAPPRAAAPVREAPRPPVSAPPAGEPRPERRDRPRRNRLPLVLAAVLLLLAAVGVGAAIRSSSGGGQALPPAAAPAPTTGVEPPPQTPSPSPSPSPEPSPSPSPSPEPSPEPAPPPPATDPVAFVQNFYSLLPENTGAAWPMLSPAAQSASGGRSGFEGFYARMDAVRVEDARLTGESTVDATVVFVENGRASPEPYRFVVSTDGDGSPFIQSFSRL